MLRVSSSSNTIGLDVYAEKLKSWTCYQIRLHDELNSTSSFGVYQSDGNGEIYLNRDAPIRGTYEGVDSMGLFSSLNGFNQNGRYLMELINKSEETLDTVRIEESQEEQPRSHL